MDLDQLQRAFGIGVDRGMHRLDERGLAHAARTPQQHVVGGQGGGETPRVVEQDVAHAVDGADQLDVDAVDARHRLQFAGFRGPDETVGRGEIRLSRLCRRQLRHRRDKPVELLRKRVDGAVSHR